MPTRADVVSIARSQLKVKYRHGHACPGTALDCYGLILVVGLSLGGPDAAAAASDPVLKGYGRAPDSAVLIAACHRYLDEIPIAQAGLGDVLTMRWETEPQHFAIITGLDPLTILHTWAVAKKVCEHNIAAMWKADIPWTSLIIPPAWRFRGIDD